jgi:hypothetical protein
MFWCEKNMHKEKKFKNVTWGIFLIENTKGIYYLGIFLRCYFLEILQMLNLLDVFLKIIDWINFHLVMNFWSQYQVLKGHWCQKHK